MNSFVRELQPSNFSVVFTGKMSVSQQTLAMDLVVLVVSQTILHIIVIVTIIGYITFASEPATQSA